MFGHWCTYPTLKIAPNPPPGIKLGIKVDNHGYQKKIKCLILIYNRVYQKKNQIPGYYFSNTRNQRVLKKSNTHSHTGLNFELAHKRRVEQVGDELLV
jgi:hypothetical protein